MIVTWVPVELLENRFGNFATLSAASFLPSPMVVSSVSPAAVSPPPIEQLNEKQTKVMF